VPATLPWLALIGGYSAMRLNEICELEVEDVKETGDNLFFDLTKAKTEAGVRVVPIHSAIIEAGFRDYLRAIKNGPLWPGLKPGGPDGKRGWYVSKRFTEYRRSLGLIDIDKVTGRDRLDFHSLRRSAVTALKHAGIPEHDAAEVVGHDQPRVTFGIYPDRQKLERLKAVIEAIQYNY
jgi:integrase